MHVHDDALSYIPCKDPMHLRDTLAINPSCWVIAITYLDTQFCNQTRITLK